MKNLAFLTSALILLTSSVFAAPKTYRLVSNANAKSVGTVESVTSVETIVGKGVATGAINFDAAKGKGSGQISIAVKGIDTGIPLRNDHMAGDQWLDAAKYPNITFKANKVQRTGRESFRVIGDFTLHASWRYQDDHNRCHFEVGTGKRPIQEAWIQGRRGSTIDKVQDQAERLQREDLG